MWCIRGSRKFCSFPGLGLKHTPPSPLPRSLRLPLQRKVSGTTDCKDTTKEDKGHGRPGAGVLPGEQRGHGTRSAGLTCPAHLASFSVAVRLSAPGGPASEGLPRRCRLGLAVGVLDARKPKTLQQVRAVWTRPGLTGRLGPVLSGHPLWTPGRGAAVSPMPTLVSGGRRETGLSLPPAARRVTRAPSQTVGAGLAEGVLGSHTVTMERDLLLTRILLCWFCFCVVFTPNLTGTRPGFYSITGPGASEPPCGVFVTGREPGRLV